MGTKDEGECRPISHPKEIQFIPNQDHSQASQGGNKTSETIKKAEIEISQIKKEK